LQLGLLSGGRTLEQFKTLAAFDSARFLAIRNIAKGSQRRMIFCIEQLSGVVSTRFDAASTSSGANVFQAHIARRKQ
jgi:hypothetical protein